MHDNWKNWMGLCAATWGAFGVIGILVFAVMRLAPITWDAIAAGLSWWQWLLLIANIILMAWSEGYRGFQLRFSPRVAARTLHLRREPTLLTGLLAPAFVVGYFHAVRRDIRLAWLGTLAIVILIVLVHRLNQPARGIIDAGVVVGLSWGLWSFVDVLVRTFYHQKFYRDPSLPDGDRAELETSDALTYRR